MVMRYSTVAAALLAVFLFGCAKSDEGAKRAQLALGSNKLMPADMPAAELAYVMDQASVKTVPARDVKYEPLETYRAANAEKAAKSTGDASDAGGDETATEGDAPSDDTPKKAKADAPKKSGGAPSLLKALGDKLKPAVKTDKAKASKPAEKKAEEKKPADKKPAAKSEEKKAAAKPAEGKKAEPAKKEAGDEAEAGEGDKTDEVKKEEGADEAPPEGEGAEGHAAEGAEGSSETEGMERNSETEGQQEGGEGSEGEKKPDEGGGG
ncbi:MAG: hypothetical protein HZA51_02205 [Planctomycetes bacterium]|nr:hypothetical protein [Planctomycetota bacterium]